MGLPRRYRLVAAVAGVVVVAGTVALARPADRVPGSGDAGDPPVAGGEFTPSYYSRWANGLPADPDFFPIGVWLQDPNRMRNGTINAVNYKRAGINTFVGQWEFPSRQDSASRLATIRAHDLYLLAAGADGSAAAVSQANRMRDASAVAGYFIGDEQDMSTNPRHVGPDEVSAQARAVRAADPSRPVYNNWGKAFSLFPWVGAHEDERGLRRYCSEIDIASSDYYAATDGYEPSGRHTPNYYGRAVDNVRRLCGPGRPAWGFVETGHPFSDHPGSWPPYSSNGTITADTIEKAVWSMLAHGANGIIYFVHDFYGTSFTEDGLFDHADAVAVLTRVNAEVAAIASILNAQRQPTGLTAVNADATLRADPGGRYVVAAENSGRPRRATFTVAAAAGRTVQVVGENRTLQADASGRWSDAFDGWGHRVYQIPA